MRWVAVVVLSVLVVAAGGCGGSDERADRVDPLCAAVWELAAIWDTQAPERILGDNDALDDFAAALLQGFNAAADTVGAAAPDTVAADLDVAAAGLERLYDRALDYAAGDMESVPVQLPGEVRAFASVRAWGTERCGPPPA